MLKEAIDRMISEYEDLHTRTRKLFEYTQSEKFKKLASNDQTLLQAQYASMVAYANILYLRIERAQELHEMENQKEESDVQ